MFSRGIFCKNRLYGKSMKIFNICEKVMGFAECCVEKTRRSGGWELLLSSWELESSGGRNNQIEPRCNIRYCNESLFLLVPMVMHGCSGLGEVFLNTHFSSTLKYSRTQNLVKWEGNKPSVTGKRNWNFSIKLWADLKRNMFLFQCQVQNNQLISLISCTIDLLVLTPSG